MTIGAFQLSGGVCRHRSALLQLALQEAGVPSRYMRGTIVGGGMHAWVEVAAGSDGKFSYVIDPNMKNRGEIDTSPKFKDLLGSNSYKAGGMAYRPLGNGAQVWRPVENVSGAENQKIAR